MGLIARIRNTLKRLTEEDYKRLISDFLTGEDLSDTYSITSETALRNSAVIACVRVLSETLASMPVKLYLKSPNGDKQETTALQLANILSMAPNEETTPYNFKETCMTGLCLNGDVFCQRIKNSKGQTVQLMPIDYNQVEKIYRDTDTNRLVYVIRSGNTVKDYTRDDVFHIPGLSINGITGLTPIGYAAKAIELGMTFEDFGLNFFKNGATSSGLLRHPGAISKPARERLVEQFAKKYTGRQNVGKPILLEEGMDYQQLSVKQADAQFLESRKFQLEDIARIYRVPLHLIQNLDRATNNNIEHQSLEFIIYTMLPWVKRWEENINMQLLTPIERRAGYFCEFKMENFLRGDVKSRYEAYAIARNWGWFSVNDIRRLENLNPIENGDVYLQPVNMAQAGQPVLTTTEGGKQI